MLHHNLAPGKLPWTNPSLQWKNWNPHSQHEVATTCWKSILLTMKKSLGNLLQFFLQETVRHFERWCLRAFQQPGFCNLKLQCCKGRVCNRDWWVWISKLRLQCSCMPDVLNRFEVPNRCQVAKWGIFSDVSILIFRIEKMHDAKLLQSRVALHYSRGLTFKGFCVRLRRVLWALLLALTRMRYWTLGWN